MAESGRAGESRPHLLALSSKSVFYHFLPRTSNQLTPLAARMQIISATDSIILRNLQQKILAASLALNVFNQQVNNAQAVHTRFIPQSAVGGAILYARARALRIILWGLNNSTLVELANLLCFINKISRESHLFIIGR